MSIKTTNVEVCFGANARMLMDEVFFNIDDMNQQTVRRHFPKRAVCVDFITMGNIYTNSFIGIAYSSSINVKLITITCVVTVPGPLR